MDATDYSRALRARLIGPHRGGRVTAVAGHPGEPQIFYFGHCAGGVWKTPNGGRFWESISDGFFKTGAVGALAVAEADPNVIIVGMGETNIRGNVSHGDGVYGSTDAGRTWRHLGLKETRHISRIRIHPRDPSIIYLSACGHVYGPKPERGVYRSTDGGATWEHVLYRGERAGAIDLAMDVTNPRILYAAFWEGQRSPYSLSSGGPTSGLFRTTDGGDTWTQLTHNAGLPGGIWRRAGVAVSPADPNRVWALVEAEDGGLFRSEDRGERGIASVTTSASGSGPGISCTSSPIRGIARRCGHSTCRPGDQLTADRSFKPFRRRSKTSMTCGSIRTTHVGSSKATTVGRASASTAAPPGPRNTTSRLPSFTTSRQTIRCRIACTARSKTSTH